MDKDTLRIIIFLIGLLVIAGMIAWSFFQHQKEQREFEEYDDRDLNNHSPTNEKSPDFDVITSAFKKTTHFITEPFKHKSEPISKNLDKQSTALPDLIQLSIIAQTEQGFNGEVIFNVLNSVNLKYGNLQIFERLDSNQQIDFAVANIVNPGVFPKDNLADFFYPGLSFFMQPKEVDHPSEVFEDFVRTFNFVAIKLEGKMLDSHHQPLTDESLQQIRQKL